MSVDFGSQRQEDVLLVDLGALFWRHWFATLSQFRAYHSAIADIEYRAESYPTVIVCTDSPLNWRHELTQKLDKDKQYKANRARKPPEALAALDDLEKKLPELGFPVAGCFGFEADDVIATLCAQTNRTVDILSEDKDLYQLISDTVSVLTRAGVMTADECRRKFGVEPSGIRDLLVLVGDASDNVSGCGKVGPLKAALLLEHFGSVEGVKNASREELLALPGVGKTIADNVEAWDPSLATQLVTLRADCPVSFDELASKYTSRIIEDIAI